MDFKSRLTEEEKRTYDKLNNVAKRIGMPFEIAIDHFSIFNPEVAKLKKRFIEFIRETINEYPNRRVVHLALRHKSARTRKKNFARIFEGVDYV